MESVARVKYLKSTLREVIFQIRFPQIIKLMEMAPADFQEKIMGAYPIYRLEKNETKVEFNGRPQQQINENNHCFISRSGKTKINLTSSFIAVSTLEYQRWEAFENVVKDVLISFYSCIPIPGIQRIGLRYKNVIVRSQLDLKDKPWSELLNPNVLGPLSTCENILNYKMDFELQNFDECFTRRHYELVRDRFAGELAMLLDCDYYFSGFFEKDTVYSRSNRLHDLSQDFLRASHKDVLLKAMQPEKLQPWSVT